MRCKLSVNYFRKVLFRIKLYIGMVHELCAESIDVNLGCIVL